MRLDNHLGKALIAIALALFMVACAVPDGATVTTGTSVTKDFTATGTIGAQGGNATTLSATTETQTLVWQGFYGEVMGNITLKDAQNNALYSWASVGGVVLASRDSNLLFSNITAQNNCTIDEDITGTGSDRVNNTFRNNSNTNFIIGQVLIAAGTSCATNTYVNNATQTTSFEEIIVTDDGGTTSIYATRIDSGTTGFDGQPHDFQMIVPSYENSTTLTYYMYAGLT
jgi:hypothetical protein